MGGLFCSKGISNFSGYSFIIIRTVHTWVDTVQRKLASCTVSAFKSWLIETAETVHVNKWLLQRPHYVYVSYHFRVSLKNIYLYHSQTFLNPMLGNNILLFSLTSYTHLLTVCYLFYCLEIFQPTFSCQLPPYGLSLCPCHVSPGVLQYLPTFSSSLHSTHPQYNWNNISKIRS